MLLAHFKDPSNLYFYVEYIKHVWMWINRNFPHDMLNNRQTMKISDDFITMDIYKQTQIK